MNNWTGNIINQENINIYIQGANKIFFFCIYEGHTKNKLNWFVKVVISM